MVIPAQIMDDCILKCHSAWWKCLIFLASNILLQSLFSKFVVEVPDYFTSNLQSQKQIINLPAPFNHQKLSEYIQLARKVVIRCLVACMDIQQTYYWQDTLKVHQCNISRLVCVYWYYVIIDDDCEFKDCEPCIE